MKYCDASSKYSGYVLKHCPVTCGKCKGEKYYTVQKNMRMRTLRTKGIVYANIINTIFKWCVILNYSLSLAKESDEVDNNC